MNRSYFMYGIYRVFFFFVMFFVTAAGIAAAQNQKLPSGIADSDLTLRLDAYFAEHAGTTAAAETAVFRGDTVIYRRNAGFADKENNIPADDATVFEWGSATKLLVWTSVMQLAEQGRLDIDAPVQRYLPDDFLTKLSWDDVISIKNLMHHNAGWEDVITGLFTESERDVSDLETALQKTQPHQIYRPGTVCAYSNWGVALAGYIVERTSGMPFWEYVQRNIFAPLGMKHTALRPDLSDNPAVRELRGSIRGYDTTGQKRIPDRFFIPLYPAGMATGTLDDFTKFAQALVPAEGEVSPLFASRKTLDELLTPSLFYGDTGLARNSHGFWISHFAVPVFGHGGNTAAMSAYLLIDPETRCGVTVMTNQGSEQIFNVKMMPLIFGDVRNAAFARSTADSVSLTAESAGYYASARTITRGAGRIYSMLMTLPFPVIKTVKTDIPGLGGILEILAPNIAEIQSPAINMLAVIQPDSFGYDKISVPLFDFIKIPAPVFFIKTGIVLFFVLSAVYAAVMLIAGCIRRILKKTSLSGKFHYLFCGAVFAAFVSYICFVMGLLTYQNKLFLSVFLVLFDCMVILQIVFLIRLVSKQTYACLPRSRKAARVCDMLAAFFYVCMTIVFQAIPLL